MAGINKVILIGNLGKDPEITNIGNDVKKASFSLATTETYKNKDGIRTDQTEWHNIVLWRGLADIAEQYLRKGSRIYLEGSIRYRSYDDKDGNKRYITEIVGDSFLMLDSKASEGNKVADNFSKPEPKAPIESVPDDDLPF
jgi:single-strand DNA-binding protein